eukprot:5316378-Pyramimonas_sp.AAC.1
MIFSPSNWAKSGFPSSSLLVSMATSSCAAPTEGPTSLLKWTNGHGFFPAADADWPVRCGDGD